MAVTLNQRIEGLVSSPAGLDACRHSPAAMATWRPKCWPSNPIDAFSMRHGTQVAGHLPAEEVDSLGHGRGTGVLDKCRRWLIPLSASLCAVITAFAPSLPALSADAAAPWRPMF